MRTFDTSRLQSAADRRPGAPSRRPPRRPAVPAARFAWPSGEGAVRLEVPLLLGVQGLGELLFGGQLAHMVSFGEVIGAEHARAGAFGGLLDAPRADEPLPAPEPARHDRPRRTAAHRARDRPRRRPGPPPLRCDHAAGGLVLDAGGPARLDADQATIVVGTEKHRGHLEQLDVVELPDVASAPRLDRLESDAERRFLPEELDHLGCRGPP